MNGKTRKRAARDTGPSAQPYRQTTPNTGRGRPMNHQTPAEGANGRLKRPVHTIRVSTLFL